MSINLCLRDLESSDLEFLKLIENDPRLWQYSDTKKPFTKDVLKMHIENSKQDIVTSGQKRFVLIDSQSNRLGLVDLFDYEKNNSRAAVGIVIIDKWRRNGYAKKGLELLEIRALKDTNIHQLYAGIISNNEPSRKLFRSAGYIEIEIKGQGILNKNEFHHEIIVQKFLDA